MSDPPAWDTAGHPEDAEDMDPGLARERTELAWRRTAISFVAIGGAVLRADPAAGAVILAMGTAVWAVPRLLHRAETAARRQQLASRLQVHLVITSMTVLVALVALVLALLGTGQLTP